MNNVKRKSAVERLAEWIARDTGLQCDATTFRRTRAGYWQKMNGAWTWEMNTLDGKSLGSIWTVKELLKSKRLTVIPRVTWTKEIDIAPDD